MSKDFQKINSGISLTPKSGTPSSPSNGDIYYNSGTGLFQFRQDGTWVAIAAGGGMTNPMTTTGDVIYSSDNSGTPARLAIGTEGATLQTQDGIPTWISGTGSGTALFAGGTNYPTMYNTIDYFNTATVGNATDFGDLTVARAGVAGCGDSTRGVFAGNSYSISTIIDYVTIAIAGNATDFGDLTVARGWLAAFSNNTYGLFSGGYDGGTLDTIDYVTIASAGNATDFGNIPVALYRVAASSSHTRALIFGGSQQNGLEVNTISYVTIATTGDATDFGDLTVARFDSAATSNKVRAFIGAGFDGGSIVNTIDYVTIASAGNATDFGDLTVARNSLAATSSSHGGI